MLPFISLVLIDIEVKVAEKIFRKHGSCAGDSVPLSSAEDLYGKDVAVRLEPTRLHNRPTKGSDQKGS
jgi:hypothetical protein